MAIMTTELCLFCNEPEKNYQPGPDVDFICDLCVILLTGAEQGDLKKAHAKAIDKGRESQASALESFIIEDEHNVRKTKKSKRNMERKRPLRKAGSSRDKVRA